MTVWWVSLDPRYGEVVFYPGRVAREIETAFYTGQHEIELDMFHDATVIFDGRDRESGIYVQVTPAEHQFTMKQAGYRNVMRIDSLPTTLFARRITGEWRLCTSAVSERVLELTTADAASADAV